MTKRAERALEVLRAGGFWCERLEYNSYLGRRQFATHLMTAGGVPVRGFGGSTKSEMELAGLLRSRCLAGNGGTCREWVESGRPETAEESAARVEFWEHVRYD